MSLYVPTLIDFVAWAPWIRIAILDNDLAHLNEYMLLQDFAFHHSLHHRDGNLLHRDRIVPSFFRSTFVLCNNLHFLIITMTSWHRKFTLTFPLRTTDPLSSSTRSSTPIMFPATMSRNCTNWSSTPSWNVGLYIFEFLNWFLRLPPHKASMSSITCGPAFLMFYNMFSLAGKLTRYRFLPESTDGSTSSEVPHGTSDATAFILNITCEPTAPSANLDPALDSTSHWRKLYRPLLLSHWIPSFVIHTHWFCLNLCFCSRFVNFPILLVFSASVIAADLHSCFPPWRHHRAMKQILCLTATSLELHELFLTKKLFTPLSFAKSLTHWQIALRNCGLSKPIIEDIRAGEPLNGFWMILPSHHWGLPRIMQWPAVHTSRHSPSNGVHITMCQTPFPKEVHLKFKNFAEIFIMFYLNKLTPIPPSKAHIPLSPTTNHYFELAGADPHFAVLKGIQLRAYRFLTLNQYFTHHLHWPRRLLQDLWLRIRRLDVNGLLSHQYLRLLPGAHPHTRSDQIERLREENNYRILLSVNILSWTAIISNSLSLLYLLSRPLLVFSVFKLCSWIFPHSLLHPCIHCRRHVILAQWEITLTYYNSTPTSRSSRIFSLFYKHPPACPNRPLSPQRNFWSSTTVVEFSNPPRDGNHQLPRLGRFIDSLIVLPWQYRLPGRWMPDLLGNYWWDLLIHLVSSFWTQWTFTCIHSQSLPANFDPDPRHLEHSNPGTHLGTSRLRWRRRNCSDCGRTEHRGSAGRLVSSLANDSTGHFPTWTTPTQSTQTVRVAHLMPSKSPRSHLAVTPKWPSLREKLSAASGSTRHVDFLWFFC